MRGSLSDISGQNHVRLMGYGQIAERFPAQRQQGFEPLGDWLEKEKALGRQATVPLSIPAEFGFQPRQAAGGAGRPESRLRPRGEAAERM